MYEFKTVLALTGPNEFKHIALYWSGEVYYEVKDYEKAIGLYQRLIDEYPNSTYVPNAYYSKGWCFYKQSLFQLALESFTKVVSDHPNAKVAGDSLYKTAECLFDLKKVSHT